MMELEGGINVTHGERTRIQPFRVCIHDADDSCGDFWTNVIDEAVAVFTIKVKRFSVRKL